MNVPKWSLKSLLFAWTTSLVLVGLCCMCDWEYREPYYEFRGLARVSFRPANASLGASWAAPGFRKKYGPDIAAEFRGRLAYIYWGTYGFNPTFGSWITNDAE